MKKVIGEQYICSQINPSILPNRFDRQKFIFRGRKDRNSAA